MFQHENFNFCVKLDQIPDEGLVLEREDNASAFEFEEKGFTVVSNVYLKCRITKTQGGARLNGEASTH